MTRARRAWPGVLHGALVVATALPTAAAAAGDAGTPGAPLSSIGWLSHSLAAPRAPVPQPEGAWAGPAVVRVTPLPDPGVDGVGLAAPAARGLARDFWGASTTDAVAARFATFPTGALPAARETTALLATLAFDPPRGGGTPGALLRARIDLALRLGRLETAAALIARAGVAPPDLVRRDFDIRLLTGDEDRGCAALAERPGLAPSLAARIFCLARRGDWAAAAVTLDSAEALGQLTPEEDALLARFLDAELAEAAPLPPAAQALTPLEWRMREAIGARPPTASLPLAFAHADLRPTAGWRARILATERLVAAGALPPDRLAGVMSERRPAASGGVWDRVAALQALEGALAARQPREIARTLPPAWEAMTAAGLAVPLAERVAPRLRGIALPSDLGPLALEIALLAGAPGAVETQAAAATLPPGRLALAAGIAGAGRATAAPGARADAATGAVAAAFGPDAPPIPPALRRLRDADRGGEAVLAALATLAPGAEADPGDIAGALALLRASGLEDAARRVAVQILLLEHGR